MITAGLVLAGAAALLHVYIFYLESIVWTGPRARSTFGTSPREAESTKSLAFNQGFYNLFLAVTSLLGVVLFLTGQTAVGATLVLTGTASMLLAALVLLLSSPDKRAAAIKQGVIPAIALICVIVGLVS